MNPVDEYAQSVVDGDVPAGKYHRLSCARHLRDRKRERSAAFPYRFDWAKAETFLKFAGKMRHYKGSQFAGQFFTPSPSQVFRLGSVFGWRQKATGLRRFTVAYNDLPRKHGKSFEGALVLVYCTFFESEAGAEGYCIATKEKQARLVFADAKALVTRAGIKSIAVNAWNLHSAKTLSKAEPLGSDSDTTDGLNPHVVVIDESHAMKTRGLIDVMESATGARRNPLFFWITTHGKDMVSPWGDQLTYACQILDGVLDDDPSTLATFAFIAHADVGDDPFVESTWIKANPHWGVSVDPDDFHRQAAKAKKMPSAAAEFKQKRLNMLPEASSQWLSMEGWREGQRVAGGQEGLAQRLEDRACWVGMDLASKLDLCAVVAAFPATADDPVTHLLRWVWTPADTVDDRALRDRAPYRIWAEQGHLLLSPGTSIDHGPVRALLVSLRERYQVQAIGYDPWHAHQLQRDLVTVDGLPAESLIEVPQSYAGLSAAALHLEAEIVAGRVNAAGCPLMTWTFANAVVQRDGKDNIQPIKKHSRGRIDPVVATCIALSTWVRNPTAKDEGVTAWVI